MPFTTSSDLPEYPSARVFFNGLLFVGHDASEAKFCHIGVHRSSPDHYLSIEVRVKRRNEADFIVMRHLGPLSFIDGDEANPGLLIKVNPLTGSGVSTYIPSRDFVRSLDYPVKEDYRWIVDLAGPDFHARPPENLLRIDSNCTEPGILLTDGTLHTALKSDDETIIKKSQGGGPAVDFYPIAAVLGANIYLEPNHDLIIQWVKDGVTQELPLERPDNPATASYEIYIDNSPTYVNNFKHRELKEYYKAIEDVPTNEQFDLVFSRPVDLRRRRPLRNFSERGDNLGTPTIPCMPVGNGGR